MAIQTTVRGVDWLAENATRKYPLTDSAGAVDISSAFTLPNEFLVDLMFPAPLTTMTNPDGFWIQTIVSYAGGLTLILAYSALGDETDTQIIGRVSVPSSQQKNTSYVVVGEPGSLCDGMLGRATIGDVSSIAVVGAFTFNIDETRIVATCVRPSFRGLSGIQIKNGNELSEIYTGAVTLVPGTNTRITATGGASPTIRIDAIDGAGMSLGCPTAPLTGKLPVAVFSAASDSPITIASASSTAVVISGTDLQFVRFDDRAPDLAIRTLAGVSPDSDGAIQVVSSTPQSVAVTGAGNTITLKSSKEPCCSNTQMDNVNSDLKQFGSDLQAQGLTLNSVESQLTALSTSDALLQMV